MIFLILVLMTNQINSQFLFANKNANIRKSSNNFFY